MELVYKNSNIFFNLINSIELIRNNLDYRLTVTNEFSKNIFFIFYLSSFFKFNSMSDLFGIDYKKHLQVDYYILSLDFLYRLLLKNPLSSSSTYSVNDIFYGSNWLEREAWDMYGIFFKDNKDLRRILTDYGFDGFPMLKVFPLSGFLEVTYTNMLKKVSSKKVEFSQQSRIIDISSEWNLY